MRKVIILLTVIYLMFAYTTYGQEGEIKGVITDGENPIELVSIGITELNIGTTTNNAGEYKLTSIPEGVYIIQVSNLGYKKVKREVTVTKGKTVELNIELIPTNLFLKEVVVIDEQTGLTNRTPYSISRVDAKQIERKGNPSGIMGFAQEDPGVYGAEMGQGIVKPFIRGLGFSRVVTIFQGNKLENHQWGADHGLGLNDVGVGNVEIIKGPASILYGSGAIGGVLLIKDDEPYLHTTKLTGNVGATFNSVSGGYRPHFSIGKSFENGLFFATDAAYENHADYVDGNNRVIGNSRFNSQTFRFHVGVDREKFKNKLSYTYLEQQLGIIEDDEMDDAESLATTRYDRKMQLPFQEVTDHILSYRQTTVHNKWVTSFNASYHINDRDEIEDAFDEVDLGLNQSHAFYNVRVSHNTTTFLENTIGVQGSFVENRNKREAEEILIPDAQYIETGIYYMANFSLGDYFVQGGIRYDNRDVKATATAPHIVDYGYNLPGDPDDRTLSRNFSGWTGSVGISKSLGEKNMLKLNLSSGFRAPDLAELFSNGPHPGTNRFEIGGDFEREQSYQADINWLFESEKFQSSFALFGNVVDNYLFFSGTGIMLDNGLEVWEFQQTNALLYGSELQFSYLPYGNDKLIFSGTANIIYGEDTEANQPLTFIPANNYTGRIQYQPLDNQPLKVFAGTRYISRQGNPGLNEETTGMYVLFNAGINHEFKLGENTLALGVTGFNLLNRTYVDHMSILRAFNITHPGRNLMMSVNFRF